MVAKKNHSSAKKATKPELPREIDGVTIHCSHNALVPIGEVRPYPANANIHPDKQVDMLAKIILKNGWRGGPVTISNQSGFVVRGHGRLQAAHVLELGQVPVDYQDYDDEALERADRLADNLVADLAEYDRKLLREEIEFLDSGVLADMDLTGWDDKLREELFTAAPPPGEGYGGGESNDPKEGSAWGRDTVGDGRTRVQMGDLDMYIDADVYDDVVEHLRGQREATGNNMPFLFEEMLKKGIADGL